MYVTIIAFFIGNAILRLRQIIGKVLYTTAYIQVQSKAKVPFYLNIRTRGGRTINL